MATTPVKPVNYAEIFRAFAEGSPVSTLSKRYSIPEKTLRTWFKEHLIGH